MTPESESPASELEQNLERLNALIPRLVKAMEKRRLRDPRLEGLDHDVHVKAAAAYLTEMVNDPARLIESQVRFWGESLRNWAEVQNRRDVAEDGSKPDRPDSGAPTDRRFTSGHWDSHPCFDLIRRQYLLSSETLRSSTAELNALDPKDRDQVNFILRQFTDMMAPTNFLATNPEALEKAVQSNGRSLVDGLENFVRDLEASPDGLSITLSDPEAFTVGTDLATTEGSVVFQNRLFQLIQYVPLTDKVYRTPLLIIPPWINKYYILDLRAKNSFIRYAVEQGRTVFVVSWANPDESFRDVGLDTYLAEGFLTALGTVQSVTRTRRVDVVGYCVGGTLTACGLAYLAATGGANRVRKATFLTALTDFEHPGELGVFINDSVIDGIRSDVSSRGYMDGYFMARTFSFLRANDLVYGPAVRSYLLGEKPPAFDLLHWNGDSTNLPARMIIEYLEQLYRDNDLANDRLQLLGSPLRLSDIRTQLFAVATIADHIAPWKSSFSGLAKTSGDKTFVLAESGHIAGIVNPPNRKKYGHWTNVAPPDDPDEWKRGAEFHPGSWWPRWNAWLADGDSPRSKPRTPGTDRFPEIEPAPGTYVRQ
ncbi:MAG: class I poly(R)-hydroxyalkanoic acid synthase [Paracoccaceae bacterium]|nr:class I poly(R)-hydroxyalkanoic acid synthase [Paracoccaceae bacterium]